MKISILCYKRLFLYLLMFQFSISLFSQLESPQKEVTYEEIQTLFQSIGTYEKLVIQTDLDSTNVIYPKNLMVILKNFLF